MVANTFPHKFDKFLDALQSILMSFLVKLGPFFVALMPALFTGYGIYHTFKDESSPELALFFALVVGMAMETVGIVSVHTAIELYNAWQAGITQPVKFWLMFFLIPVYVLGVSFAVYASEDAFTPLVKGLGIVSPFLTCIVYIAVALARDLRRTEEKMAAEINKQDEIEAEQRQWERDKERLGMELKHQEKLARIEAKRVNQGVNLDNQPVKNGVKNNVFDTINLSREERKRRLLDAMVNIYLDNPSAGVSEIAHKLSVSRQTVYNYQNELEQAGRLHKNEQGWEVAQ